MWEMKTKSLAIGLAKDYICAEHSLSHNTLIWENENRKTEKCQPLLNLMLNTFILNIKMSKLD